MGHIILQVQLKRSTTLILVNVCDQKSGLRELKSSSFLNNKRVMFK